MLVVHANWSDGALHVWGESLDAFATHSARAQPLETRRTSPRKKSAEPAAVALADPAGFDDHPFAASSESLQRVLSDVGLFDANTAPDRACLGLRLPRSLNGPLPSERLARLAAVEEILDGTADASLGEFNVPSLRLAPAEAMAWAANCRDRRACQSVDFSPGVRFWAAVADFALELLSDQRFVPTLIQSRENGLRAAWQPWLHDDDAAQRVSALLKAMPPAVRAAVDEHAGRPWQILEDAVRRLVDAAVRQALEREQFAEAIEDRDPAVDAHVAWLSGLLAGTDRVPAPPDMGARLLSDVGAWIDRLEEGGRERAFRLCLQLREPPAGSGESAPDRDVWRLTLHLQSADSAQLVVDASEVWDHASQGGTLAGQRIENPQELLLAELGRASRIYPKLESALSQNSPTQLELTTAEAYEFLRDARPVLEEAGVNVLVPDWWDKPLGRLGARIQIDSPSMDQALAAFGPSAPAGNGAPLLGLNSLVQFRWQIAIGDQPLTHEELESLSRSSAPLVRVGGRWIEIGPQQLAEARQFLEQSPKGEITLLKAIQMAHGADGSEHALPVFGLDAKGWVADVLGASTGSQPMRRIDQPPSFVGALRPYQKSGLSWLAFLDQFGLGACLADDMGLGKTIQLIALLLHERRAIEDPPSPQAPGNGGSLVDKGQPSPVGPTLLVVPTSVVSNWLQELHRFAPDLKAHVHHGPDRLLDERFTEAAMGVDLVITTYPLVGRDQAILQQVRWHRLALDEAQYIKNPPTKQARAIRSLHAPRRIALTGTPVENRLSELWSIMEFCNPGYLGSSNEFRRHFSLPIERRRDMHQADRLRHMVRPFILRRVKSDPSVIDDLPACLETREYATLTPQQAALYQKVVSHMLGEVDRAEGIQRRGLVLAALVKLKQICNHPDQLTSAVPGSQSVEDSPAGEPAEPGILDIGGSAVSSRSGKTRRLLEMLEEVVASGDKALVFTQFRRMGHLLAAMIERELDCDSLFLHGGTPANKRQHLIDRFQTEPGGPPIFILSLKAGGLGLNLTAANHVFHFDRWWNPAVEKQATDRAFRIGQTRTVHVHKFVCVGTLEERIDQMIEEKTDLAENIIGSGEQWLTELSTNQLRDLLTLRQSALEGE